jgi:hypothetical protein
MVESGPPPNEFQIRFLKIGRREGCLDTNRIYPLRETQTMQNKNRMTENSIFHSNLHFSKKFEVTPPLKPIFRVNFNIPFILIYNLNEKYPAITWYLKSDFEELYIIFLMEFQKSLQKNLGEHDPTQVDELILDDLYTNVESFSTDHKKTLELYNSLIHLSLNGMGLKSLKNFPKIPSLQILEIRQNKLNGSEFGELKNLYPKLYKLKVGENPIDNMNVFKELKGLTELKKLELVDSGVAKKETYKEELFELLPQVEIIDRMNREGEETDTTIYDAEGDEFDEDDEGFEDIDDEDIDDDEEFEDGDDDEDEDEDEDEEDAGKKGKKPKH